MIPFGLPGIWVQFLAAVLATVFLGHLGWFWTILIFVMAVGAEIVDFVIGHIGLKATDGSKFAEWTALFCGFIFAFFGFLIPIPIPVLGMLLGSMIMSFIGTFSGAILGEMIHQQQLGPSLRVATGAVIGRACGIATKLWIAFVALCIAMTGMVFDFFR